MFDPLTGPPKAALTGYTQAFAEAIIKEAESDRRVVAITAAMTGPTGLIPFAERFPDRCFDVGIAEQHAVTAAAGMALGGLRPVVAVYSTFLNRAWDQVVYDVAMHKAPVVFALDRAGVTGPDGASHHGVYDMALLSKVPGMRVLAPSSAQELHQMLHDAIGLADDGPVTVRYARGFAPTAPESEVGHGLHARQVSTSDDATVCILAVGKMVGVGHQGRRRTARRAASRYDGVGRAQLRAARSRDARRRRPPRADRHDRGRRACPVASAWRSPTSCARSPPTCSSTCSGCRRSSSRRPSPSGSSPASGSTPPVSSAPSRAADRYGRRTCRSTSTSHPSWRSPSELADLADAITLPAYERRSFSVDWKANHTEVTEADRGAEAAIVERLLTERPRHGDLRRGARHGRRRVVAVALDHRPDRRHLELRARRAGVGDADRARPRRRRSGGRRGQCAGDAPPLVGRRRVSARSSTATPITVSDVASIGDAQVSVTFSPGWDEIGRTDRLVTLQRDAYRARGYGDFWQHMLVAEGAVDVAVDAIGVAPYDVAAPMVVVEQAGGRFTDRCGARTIEHDSAVSSNGLLHPAVIDRLA